MEIINPVIVKDGLYISGSVHVQGTVNPNLVLGGVFSSSAQVVYGEIVNIPSTTTVSSDSLSGSLITVTGSIDFTESVGGKYLDLNGYKLYRADFQFTNTASYLELFQVPTGSSGTIQLHSNFDTGSNYYEWEWVYSDASLILSQSFYGNEYSSASIELSIIGGDLIITNVKNDNIALNTVVKTFSESELLVVNTEKPALLLDLYGDGVSVAYSLRKLRTNYTGSAVRVRNDSNVEVDIGFDAFGNLDTGSLETHCGAGNGFVSVWYDQSGNVNNAIQSTTASQPKIYNVGSVVLENGKPAMDLDGSNDYFSLTHVVLSNQPYSIFTTLKRKATSTDAWTFAYSGSNIPFSFLIYRANQLYMGSQRGFAYVSYNTNTQILGVGIEPYTGNILAYINGNLTLNSSIYTGYATSNGFNTFGARLSTTGEYSNMIMQEAVYYLANKTTDRLSIEQNINNYYLIY